MSLTGNGNIKSGSFFDYRQEDHQGDVDYTIINHLFLFTSHAGKKYKHGKEKR